MLQSAQLLKLRKFLIFSTIKYVYFNIFLLLFCFYFNVAQHNLPLLSNANALTNPNNYNSMPSQSLRRGVRRIMLLLKVVKKMLKEVSLKKSLSLKGYFNNKITIKNTPSKLASRSAALVCSSYSSSSLLASRSYSYSYKCS